MPRGGQPAVPAGDVVPLVVRDFDPGEHADKSLSADLLRAVPDTLYLYFLGYSRLGVSRGPSVPRVTSTAPHADQHNAQVPAGPSGSFYSLEGTITVASLGTSAGSQLLYVRYQVWLNGAGAEAKLIMEDRFVAGSGELAERFSDIARAVSEKIIPPEAPLSVFVPPVDSKCFSSDPVRRFYQGTMTGLLRSTLFGTGFVKSAPDRTGAYAVTESAEEASGICTVRATLTGKDGRTINTFTKKGPTSDILDTQALVSQQVVDALRLESHSISQKTASSPSLSPKDYMQAADKARQSDPELAVALYRKALSVEPSNQEARNRLAQTLLDSGRPKEVIDLIPAPATASQFALLAAAYLKLNDSTKAVARLNQGLQLHSPDPEFYQQAAGILEQSGEYAAAANALELGQKYAHPNAQFADMANQTRRRGAAKLLIAGKNEEALQLVLPSLDTDPNSEWGQRLAGIAYHRLRDTQKAEQHLREADRIQPTAYSKVELGTIQLEQKRYAEARDFAHQAIQVDPRYSRGYSLLLESIENDKEASQKDAAQAVEWTKEYLNMDPPNRAAIVAWEYLESKYFPFDSAAIHQQYEVLKSATKGVPYMEWVSGWSDLVEAAMEDNHVKEAADLADALLNVNLDQEHRMTMGFYSWLTYLVLGDCTHFVTNLNAHLDFLGNRDLPDKNGWDFTATEAFVKKQASQGKLNQSGMSLVASALKLLENPIKPSAVQQFSNDAARFRKAACPVN